MKLDFDTFVVALYTIIDDQWCAHFAHLKPVRRGHQPELSDSKVLSLVILAQWLDWPEWLFIDFASKRLQPYFPRLLCQSSFNRRARDLTGVLVHLVPLTAEQLEADLAQYETLDGVPVPLMRRCRGVKHRLFADEASVGKGGSDKDFYYGCKLVLGVASKGAITGFMLGPAATEERWIADALLCWRSDPYAQPWGREDVPPNNHRKASDYVGPTGPIWPRDGAGKPSRVPYIADGGYSGGVWASHWQQDYQAEVLTTTLYKGEEDEAAKAQHRRWRHVIETVNGHLEGELHLAFPRARGIWGLLTKVAAKLVAFNLGMLINRLFGRPDFAIATLFSF